VTDNCQYKKDRGGSLTRRQLLKTSGCFVFALAGLPVFAMTGSAALGSPNEKRYPVPSGDCATIDRQSQVILVRYQGEVYAFALSCPHENAAVKWLPKDNRFQCSKHDSQYRPDGLHTSGRATRNMDRFAVRLDGASIVVDVTHWFQSDKDPAGWAAAAIRI
jgi:nitrite reductase/ring-hydroxylating ferredoxin subunit